ncbi:hypothetical protein BDM02DRAFT_3093465 [Thelephora ganbajun]|uniref:Uncharacterized protein n=1 Tax=Thelephora ganbajun TaxID=370292 RepID=A0ACB6ZLC9_THEGA|nr:hypothetical protein BDM02DRAFT_3093465 [Thelephora ganbajun]
MLGTGNGSAYTLDTVHFSRPSTPSLHSSTPSYGSIPHSDRTPPGRSRDIIVRAGLKMALIFVVSCVILGGTLWIALPTLDEEDRDSLRIPKSFAQLQVLNHLLKKYRDIYPFRVFVCYVSVYLFLQAFSLPGSMYLSILGGAVWGVARALPLACTCVATGASLCYLLSAALGPAILTLPRWKDRLEKWSDKVQAQKENIVSFLIVLRIAPLPPHWVVNIICPHVGIGLVPFWISTFLGVFGVSVIHTTIGGGLDEMTSADDFHLLSWRNFLLLSSVVVGVLIPVGLRYYLRRGVGSVDDIEAVSEGDQVEDRILAQGPPGPVGKGKPTHIIYRDESESEDEDEDEEDIILEAGPVVITKSPSSPLPPGSTQSPSSSTEVLL